jgi:hypothetical protein
MSLVKTLESNSKRLSNLASEVKTKLSEDGLSCEQVERLCSIYNKANTLADIMDKTSKDLEGGI